MKSLPTQYSKKIEAGTDEAGRGCLAGPVSAAAVIFSENYSNPDLNDSKKLSEKKRNELRKIIRVRQKTRGLQKQGIPRYPR